MPESDEPAFHRTGIEMRYAKGAFLESGAAIGWLRLTMPVVAGETPTPLQRALAAADFGNGVSAVLPWDQFVFINTDLTVYLHREPEGEWVCLDARTDVDHAAWALHTAVCMTSVARWADHCRGCTSIAARQRDVAEPLACDKAQDER